MSNQIEELLREEMRAIEAHRKRYLREHPGLRIDREDPEVRLLIESLAYSAVKTRLATVSEQEALWRRLFSSQFDYLLRGLPTMGILRAEPTAALVDTAELARGESIQIENADGETSDFELMRPLRVIPVTLAHVQLLPLRRGQRLVLGFVSQFPRTDPPETMRIFIDYLGDYLAALQVQYNIQVNLERAFVVYDRTVDDSSDGQRCHVTFGESDTEDENSKLDGSNPIEEVRDFWHFPQRHLFINIAIPPPRQSYFRFALCLDLGPNFVAEPPIYRDLFVPFAVPIRNTRRDYSRPISVDGTKVAHPVLHVLGDPALELWRVLGVYELLPQGMAPLLPASLGSVGAAYEIEERVLVAEDGETRRTATLLLSLPDALHQKRQVVVDAQWQPSELLRKSGGRLRITSAIRQLPGMQLRLTGALRPAVASTLTANPDGLLEMLALKMRSTLNISELKTLLRAIGTLQDSRYEDVLNIIEVMQVQAVKDGSSESLGIRHKYRIRTAEYPQEHEALVWNFFMQIQKLLDAWNHEATTLMSIDGGQHPLRLPLAEVRR